MRILVVSQYFYPEVFRINEILQSLVMKGFQVDVLTGKPNYPEGKIYSNYRAWGLHKECIFGINVIRVPLVPRGERSSFKLLINYLSFIVSGLIFGPWVLRRKKYDIVFVYGLSPIFLAIPGIFLAKLFNKPLVLWVQDLWPDSLAATGFSRNGYVLFIIKLLVRWIYSCCDLLLVQSPAFVQAVSKLAPNKKIIYYPNSVDDSFCDAVFDKKIYLPIFNILEECFSVVFAGNVGVAQDVDVILDAAILLRDHIDIRFVVIGHGRRWHWLQQQVVQHGLTNLYLPGRFPFTDMPVIMQKASALLVTLSDEPIFSLTVPSKVQAYMAAGRPIIAALNGEGARIVREAKAGISVSAHDAAALAGAVLSLKQMPLATREAFGYNGRQYFKAHFDHEMLVNQLIFYLNNVVDLKAASA